jgi:transcriptional regulator with XRE-family HTH domain
MTLRESRVALGLTQREAADRAGVSQGFWSHLERGGGTMASLETLASCAAAVGTELAAFLEARPGADLPRDIAHLRGQEAIVRFARSGGWRARVERAIDPAARRSRSIDVQLEREGASGPEIAVVELLDLLTDGGEAMRSLADKTAAMRRAEPRARVAALLVLRATRRNRTLVTELASVIQARFPAGSRAWIAALTMGVRPMPRDDGVVWARVDGTALFAVGPPRASRIGQH